MNKLIVSIVVSLLVGAGFGYVLPHGANPSQMVGNLYEPEASHFFNGFYAGSADQFSVDSAGALTAADLTSSDDLTVSGDTTLSGSSTLARLFHTGTGTSSSSPAALGSATAGKIVIPASATVVGASTTAVTANSLILLTQTATTSVISTTCNTDIASGTQVSVVTPGNGFVVKTQIAPTTNPFCYNFLVIN